MGEKWTCTVRDGNFVEPCDTLSSVTDNEFGGFTKARGVTRWQYTNLTTRQPSRTFFGVKSKAYPNGFNFNFCPFCGVDISAPFIPAEDTPTESTRHAG